MNRTKVDLIQAIWDQMRGDLSTYALPQLNQASQALLNRSLGSLTESQAEDLESVQRSLARLNQHIDGEPIDWVDYGEAAHALRGPLNSTIGFSRLLLKGVDGPINDAQRTALARINEISRRLLALFNLLLDALLITADRISFNIEPIQAAAILEEVVAAGHVLANSRGFLFEADVAPNLDGVVVRCDVKRLKQVLSALLAVSARYMKDGFVNLRAGSSGTELLIRLLNSDCRLPAPLLADLPHLLTDADDHSYPYDARLRLGLAWHLVAMMEGSLQADHADATCAFTLTLPLG
jgi:signal transduction histidine kinase